jgi:hypothetical protein
LTQQNDIDFGMHSIHGHVYYILMSVPKGTDQLCALRLLREGFWGAGRSPRKRACVLAVASPAVGNPFNALLISDESRDGGSHPIRVCRTGSRTMSVKGPWRQFMGAKQQTAVSAQSLGSADSQGSVQETVIKLVTYLPTIPTQKKMGFGAYSGVLASSSQLLASIPAANGLSEASMWLTTSAGSSQATCTMLQSIPHPGMRGVPTDMHVTKHGSHLRI